MSTLLENPGPGEGDALAEFHRNERHAQDGQAGVEGPVARTGFVFLPLHVARSVIADFTAAPMAADELREGLRRTGRTSAQKVGNRIFPIFFLARGRRCRGGGLPGGDFEPLAGGLDHGFFPDDQGADVGQSQPQRLYLIDLVNPPLLAPVVEFVGFAGKRGGCFAATSIACLSALG